MNISLRVLPRDWSLMGNLDPVVGACPDTLLTVVVPACLGSRPIDCLGCTVGTAPNLGAVNGSGGLVQAVSVCLNGLGGDCIRPLCWWVCSRVARVNRNDPSGWAGVAGGEEVSIATSLVLSSVSFDRVVLLGARPG